MSVSSREHVAGDEAAVPVVRRLPQVRLGWPEAKEWALWLIVVAGVLNFAPSLFSTSSVSTEPIWTKAVKILPSLLLLAIMALELRRRGWPPGRPELRRLTLALAAVAAFMAVSVVAIGSPSEGDVASAQYYLVYPLLAIGLAAVPLSREQTERLLLLLVALGVFEAILAIPDTATVFAYTNQNFAAGGHIYNRAIGTLGNPNNLGLFLGLCIIIAASNATRASRRMRTAAVAIMLLGLFLTFSKTAAIALGIASLLLITGGLRRRLLFGAAGLAVAGALTVAAVLIRSEYQPIQPAATTTPAPAPAPTTTPTTPATTRPAPAAAPATATPAPAVTATAATGGQTSVIGNRRQTASRAFHRWTASAKSFLVGSGYATLADVTSTGQLNETVVDNMPLGLALEGGVVGLLLFSALVCCALLPLVRARVDLPVLTATRAYALLFLLYAPISVNFRLFPTATFFWVLVGLTLGLLRTAGTGGRPAAGMLARPWSAR